MRAAASGSTSCPSCSARAARPYDRSGVVPYSFRHSFAQRHADSGTPIEVLAELMGHSRLTTTQAYYKNSQELHLTGENLQVA